MVTVISKYIDSLVASVNIMLVTFNYVGIMTDAFPNNTETFGIKLPSFIKHMHDSSACNMQFRINVTLRDE